MATYSWSYAPTNRATCKGKCKEKIAKGAVRLGVSSDDGHHTMVSYRCLDCVTDLQIKNIVTKVGAVDKVEGFDGLEGEDRAAVLEKAGVKAKAASSSSKPARKAASKPKPKAKPEAKAARAPKGKAAPKEKAAPKGRAAPKDKAVPKAAALPPIAKQHEFLDKAKEYDLEAVKEMVAESPTLINVQPAGRWSALHQFAEKGDVDAVRWLLENGADRTLKTKDGQTPEEVAHEDVQDVFNGEDDEEEDAEDEGEEEEEEAEEEEPPVEEEKKGTKRKAPEKPPGSPVKTTKPSEAATPSPAKKAKTSRPVDASVPNRDTYTVAGDWSVLLNQTNVGANNNKFYRIQVLKDTKSKFFCWTRWGRVGAAGQHNLAPCPSEDSAQAIFKSKFKDKSGVHYDLKDSHDWKPVIGKYTLVDTEEQDGDGGGESAPLGKLTEQQIEKGQEVLQRIETALAKKNDKQLTDLSSEYYTLIPHDFGFKVPPAIKTREMLEAEEELLKFYLRMGFEEVEKEDDGLLPISGVMSLALPKSLESACSGICSSGSIKSSMTRGKKHEEKQSGGPSKAMESHLYGAIMLYTSNAIYKQLNAALRSEDRNKIKKYKPYLRLLFEALNRLPQQKRTLWRGIGVDLYDQYKTGSTITWWGVSSCTSDEQVAKNFMKGCGGSCTLLTVKTKTAADISEITFYGNEKESLLAPGTQLKVVNSARKGKVSEITLEEVGRAVD
ncbi:PARP2 [Symbiodinium natans]|uniref:NAD(P)(+)--arginine ADP-ribosyltransferase n=1 Tax=Symbiodinium natans TaxID=878477 RepID=A0A812R2Y4_9DINO|nr:PARP2 [Symbiodinium natans]